MSDSTDNSAKENKSHGNVYIMEHSFFSGVIRIGCTPDDPIIYTDTLSKKSPGNYRLVYSAACNNPCQITQQVKKYLSAKKYVNEFYEVSPNIAVKLFKQEVLRIPTINRFS